MKLRLCTVVLFGLVPLVVASGCMPKSGPKVDTVATAVAQAAIDLLTQTAAAASPTPLPPTPTPTLTPTETPTITPTSGDPPRRPQTVSDGVSCWLGGPPPSYPLETHLRHGKAVDLLGTGSVPGWYIIRDPFFHRPCWISTQDLKIFPGTDPSTFPVMTPGIPVIGQ